MELARSSAEVQQLLRTHHGGTSDPLDIIEYDVHEDQIWQEADRDDNDFHWSRRSGACADEYYVDVTYLGDVPKIFRGAATPNVNADLNAENHMFLVDRSSAEVRRVSWDADFAGGPAPLSRLHASTDRNRDRLGTWFVRRYLKTVMRHRPPTAVERFVVA